MLTTVTGACPLCGLRFGNRPLLELHIRDDHRRSPVRRKGRPDGEDDEDEEDEEDEEGPPEDQPESLQDNGMRPSGPWRRH